MIVLSTAKRYVTLIEMMVVIAIISLLLGALAWNYGGVFESTKAENTNISMNKLRQVLELHLAHHPEDIDRIESDWQTIVSRSPLVDDSKKITKDGWGKTFVVRVEETDEGGARIIIISESLTRFKKKK